MKHKTGGVTKNIPTTQPQRKVLSVEERLELWLQQPNTFVTEAERNFIRDMRTAAAQGVGYGWMKQVIDWEWDYYAPPRTPPQSQATVKDQRT